VRPGCLSLEYTKAIELPAMGRVTRLTWRAHGRTPRSSHRSRAGSSAVALDGDVVSVGDEEDGVADVADVLDADAVVDVALAVCGSGVGVPEVPVQAASTTADAAANRISPRFIETSCESAAPRSPGSPPDFAPA
jgi:hypothetical protein